MSPNPYDLPMNCWLDPDGIPHGVDLQHHAHFAIERVREWGEKRDKKPSTGDVFHLLYSLGWVRVQWEATRRINVVFHCLTPAVWKVLRDFIEVLLASGVEVYAASHLGSEFIRPEERHWQTRLTRLSARKSVDEPLDPALPV